MLIPLRRCFISFCASASASASASTSTSRSSIAASTSSLTPLPTVTSGITKQLDASITLSSNETEGQKNPSLTVASLLNGQPVPWPSHLHSSLSRLSPSLSRATVLRSLDHIKPPAAALCFFRWAQRNLPAEATALLDDRAHFKMLQVLCRSRNLSLAREFLISLHADPPDDSLVVLHDRFFNTLIRAYAHNGQIREAIALFDEMEREFRVPPSVFTLNTLLSVLLQRGRTHAAGKLFEEMTHPTRQGSHIKPDTCTFNTLIRGFCLNGMVDEGFRSFRDMARWQCEPDLQTYNTLLDGLCRVGKVGTAQNFLNGMMIKGPDLAPNVVSYTTVIRGYCRKRHLSDAISLFQKMVADGVRPNAMTCNTLVQGLCEAGEMEQLNNIMKGLLSDGADGERVFKPDTCTFNTIITAYCSDSRLEDALSMFKRMPEFKLKPDSATYSVLIRGLCSKSDFKRAEQLLDELIEKEVLLKKVGCQPLMAAYSPMLEHLCSNGKAKKAGILFKQLLTSRCKADAGAFNIMIMGHCKDGELRAGHELLVTMIRQDLVPDITTFQTLVDGFLEKRESVFAWKAFRKMLDSGHRPKTATFHAVLDGLLKAGYAEEARDIAFAMLERKVLMHIDLSTETAVILYEKCSKDNGFDAVVSLYKHGYSLKMEKLTGFLCNKGKFEEALELLLFSMENHPNLSEDAYCKAISGLCDIGKGAEAFKLFYELNENGKGHGVLSCLPDLEFSLEKEGKLVEAEFVRKRKSVFSV